MKFRFIFLNILFNSFLAISDINKVSNEIFSILNKSLNIIKTKKYHHSVKTSNTATSTVTSQKHVKSTPAMTSETIKLVRNINIC